VLLCLAVPDYPLAVALGHRERVADTPAIIADRYDRGHVIALDDLARRYGARVGQTVTQAAAAAPHARVAVYDAVRGDSVWSDMLDALDAVTPMIDDVRPGTAYLDMRGIDGDLDAWIARIETALQPFDMPLRIGAGPNKFCAYAATWIGNGTLIERGEEVDLLAPLPLDVLDVKADVFDRLHLLGCTTLGELARLPHGPFVRRFGRDAVRWHECARGIDRTPFVPRGHTVSIEAAVFGEGHADDEAQVFFALRVLLARIASDLERAGRRAALLHLDVELDNADTHEYDVALASPTAEERSMLDVLRAKLEGATFPAPITGLRVRAQQLEENGEELPLFAADEIDKQLLAVTIARLEAALGEPVVRASMCEAHPIEERFRYEPFALPKREFLEKKTATHPAVTPQLRLLTVREIDVRVVRGEPAFVALRAAQGDTVPQAVLECAGPWRVEEGWFATPVVRDEYDVLLEDGELYRIYRQGARWYLRGAYD
jgi:protein ImuB